MSTDYPKNIVFECTNCGICCGDTAQKTRHILLTTKDAQRITEYTNKPLSSLFKQIKKKTPYLYEIKKHPKTKKCIFHKNNQCTIYLHRPLICRFYPFQLTTKKGKHIFRVTLECPGVFCMDTLKVERILGAHYFEGLLRLAYAELSIEDGVSGCFY